MKKTSIIFIILLTILSFIFSLPYLASTHWGNAQLLKLVNSQTTHTFKAEKIHLSWLGPQTISKGELIGSNGDSLLVFEKADLNSPLLKLLWKRIPVGILQLSSMQARIDHYDTVQPIIIKNVNAWMAFEEKNKPMALLLSGLTQQGDVSGEFKIDLQLGGIQAQQFMTRNLLDLFQETPGAHIKVKANIANLPVDLLDQLLAHTKPGLRGILGEGLGKYLNITIDQYITKDYTEFTVEASSAHLKAKMEAELTSQKFSLKEPARITFQLTPDLISKISYFTSNKWDLIQSTQAALTIDQFELPFETASNKATFNLDEIALATSLTMPQVELVENITKNTLAIRTLHLTMNKEAHSKTAAISLSSEAAYNGYSFAFNISPMQWQIANDQRLSLLNPFTLHASLSPQLINNFLFHEVPAKLHDEAVFDFIVKNISTSLVAFNPYETQIQAEAKCGSLQLSGVPLVNEMTLSNLNIGLRGNSLAELVVTCDTELTQKENNSALSLFVGPHTQVSLASKVQISDRKTKVQDIQASLKSDLVTANFAGNLINSNQFVLLSPATINYRLTTPLMHYLGIANNFSNAMEEVPIEFIVDRPNDAIDFSLLSQLRLTGKIKMEELALTAEKNVTTFRPLFLSWALEGPTNTIFIEFDGKTAYQNELGNLKGNIVLKDWLKGNALNRENLSLASDIKINGVPTNLLSQLAFFDSGTRKKASLILGDIIHGDIKVALQQMSGPVYASLKGNRGSLFLEGSLQRNHLTLVKPFELTTVVRPELGQYLFQDSLSISSNENAFNKFLKVNINSEGFSHILSEAISSNKPLKLTINPQGFSLPLFPLKAEEAEIDQGMLELGEVQFVNNGKLSNIVSSIIPIKRQHLSLWFTPTYFSLHKGSLKLQRTDILIDKQYPIASWGKINFIKDKVNMTVALSGLAISKAFNVTIKDKDYFLQLPLRGTLKDASIDKAKATARISALIAQSQGTPHGTIIGTFLDIAGGNLRGEKVPPPTTNPLPWTDLVQEDTQPVSQESKDSIDPLQEIEKKANSLLKNLFK